MIKTLGLLLAGLVLTGCGSSTATSPSVNYSGTWSGTFGTGAVSTVTWTATQSGASVTGPAVVVVSGGIVQFTGTITGTTTSDQLALTISVPAGAIAAVPGCSISGSGTSTVATATSIVATITTTFSSACLGTVTSQSTAAAALALTKR